MNLGLVIWVCPWATTHTKYVDKVMGLCKTVTVSNLWCHWWAVHSLIFGLRGLLFSERLVFRSLIQSISLLVTSMYQGGIKYVSFYSRQYLRHRRGVEHPPRCFHIQKHQDLIPTSYVCHMEWHHKPRVLLTTWRARRWVVNVDMYKVESHCNMMSLMKIIRHVGNFQWCFVDIWWDILKIYTERPMGARSCNSINTIVTSLNAAP